MDLSVIIVNYNTCELLKQTVQSVIENTSIIKYEIIVVDNASNDNSFEMIKRDFSNVKLFRNDANLGFSKANNIGISHSQGRYVLLLNSDTIVLKDCLEKCVHYMDNHLEAGALGCKVALKDGGLDHACKRGFPTPQASLYYLLKLNKLFPNSKRFAAYDLSYLSDDEINEVDSLTGAFMMVRREAIDRVGLLDEQFFMYGEDLDWCLRIKEDAWNVIYYPEVQIVHYKGASSKKKRIKTIYEFHRAMYLFYKKHYYRKYNLLIYIFVCLGIGLKLIQSFGVNSVKRDVSV
jgi:GT2 family glycosyltransferase